MTTSIIFISMLTNLEPSPGSVNRKGASKSPVDVKMRRDHSN